ncbi:MAG: hypothetical protein V7704_14980 [Aurantimonas endophytica]|uniref:hypothetical protein n=1 Tax=Aurantimonas endophytica TaxID=1522175 RepID=UPI00300160FD
MVRSLLVTQDKGGVGKSLVVRALAEAVPEAPIVEIDSSQRLVELEGRTTFFPMRADRSEIERTGGRASRAEFDKVIDAIANATAPTIIDVGANTGRSLLSVLSDIASELEGAGVEVGVLTVVTNEPGALAEAPKLMKLAAPWSAARFVLENRLRGPVDPKELKLIAAGAPISVLEAHILEDAAGSILQDLGLVAIPNLDGAALTQAHGLALGARIRRDLVSLRANAMEAVRTPAEWLVGG